MYRKLNAKQWIGKHPLAIAIPLGLAIWCVLGWVTWEYAKMIFLIWVVISVAVFVSIMSS